VHGTGAGARRAAKRRDGIAFFELLTARNPYEDKARDSFLERLAAGQVPPPKFPDDKVPQSLVELVGACTDQDPNLRPSMAEIVRRLDLFIATAVAPVTVGATSVPRAERPHDAAGAALPTVEAQSVKGSEAKRWRWIAVAAIVVAVLALALAAVVLLLREDPQPMAGVVEEGTTGEPDDEGKITAGAPTASLPADLGVDAAGSTAAADGSTTGEEPEPTPHEPTRSEAPPEPAPPHATMIRLGPRKRISPRIGQRWFEQRPAPDAGRSNPPGSSYGPARY
jgi:hypothetical protein